MEYKGRCGIGVDGIRCWESGHGCVGEIRKTQGGCFWFCEWEECDWCLSRREKLRMRLLGRKVARGKNRERPESHIEISSGVSQA